MSRLVSSGGPSEDALIGSILDDGLSSGVGVAAPHAHRPVESAEGTVDAAATNGHVYIQRPSIAAAGPIHRSTSAPPQLHLEGLLVDGEGGEDVGEPGQVSTGFNTNPYAATANGDNIVINGETIRPDDQRLSAEYYHYYFSQKPLDPRLPPPLVNWSNRFPRHQTQHHHAHPHPVFDARLHVADSPQLGSVLGTSPGDLGSLSTLDASPDTTSMSTVGAGGSTSDAANSTPFATFPPLMSDPSLSVSPGALSNPADEMENRMANMSLATTNSDGSTITQQQYQPPNHATENQYAQQHNSHNNLYSQQQPPPSDFTHPAALAAAAYFAQQQQNPNYNPAYRQSHMRTH
jgi:hypothetical protein